MTRVLPRRPSRRATRRGIVVSAAGALVLAAALLWQSAYAGFTDTTTPLTAGVGSGTVALSTGVEGLVVRLDLPEMRPGYTNSECVTVKSTGSVPALVKLYGADRTGSSALLSQISFVWATGTGGGANGDCTGFTPVGSTYSTTMASFPTSYGSGSLPWTTAGNAAGESRTYRLTYTFASGAPATVKGQSAGITFVWEAQNT